MNNLPILRALLDSYIITQQTHHQTADQQYRRAKHIHELKEKMRSELDDGASYQGLTHQISKRNGKLKITRI